MSRYIFLFALASVIFSVIPRDVSAQISFSDEVVPEFQALAELEEIVIEQIQPDVINDVGQTLINGTPVDPREFPAVLRMVTGGTCTAALVGPSTVLFAAHCLQGNTRIRFRSNDTNVRGICTTSPTYDPFFHHQDWALCLLERRANGVVYETLDVENLPQTDDRLMLSGYGCTIEGGNLDGRLRIGFSNVVPRPANARPESSAIFTISSIAAGDAVICPGDSGGPLFRSGANADGPRQIVGVNSRTTFSLGVSVFSATASPEGASFIREWASTYGQQICGVNLELGCK